jgi:hypothetical protein
MPTVSSERPGTAVCVTPEFEGLDNIVQDGHIGKYFRNKTLVLRGNSSVFWNSRLESVDQAEKGVAMRGNSMKQLEIDSFLLDERPLWENFGLHGRFGRILIGE